jgi:excisionase family DNA binding protein
VVQKLNQEETALAPPRRTISAKDAAALLGVTHATACAMARSGQIPALRAGRTKWLIPTARFYREVLGEEPPA